MKRARTVKGTCPTGDRGVRTMGQVGNFEREYLSNGNDSEAHLWMGKRGYPQESICRADRPPIRLRRARAATAAGGGCAPPCTPPLLSNGIPHYRPTARSHLLSMYCKLSFSRLSLATMHPSPAPNCQFTGRRHLTVAY